MPINDAAEMGQFALRLHLITEEQLRECLQELGSRSDPPATLLRLLERRNYLSSWQSSKLIKEDRDGYFLGGYRLLYRIAAGSFGRVFRADDPRTGEIVAIKVLRRRWTEDAHKVALFEREGKVGLTLQHPNIVRILSVSKDAKTGQHYIVMEFVEGGNLRDILKIHKKMGRAEALRILEECAAGLAFAHSRGMTHRDIKPSNILLAASGTARLVDFGLAEITGPSDDDTSVDRTVDYSGLERATGVRAGDIRSDIYFLGTTIFELLTGRPLLLPTKNKQSRMLKQRFVEAGKAIQRDDPDMAGPIYSLMTRMTADEPAERFQTPAQLLEAVRTIRAELEGGTAPKQAIPTGEKTVYVIEAHSKLQDAFRESLRERGWRVLMSMDASRAVQRYQQTPYHALIVDVGTVGESAIPEINRLLGEVETLRLKFCAAVILNEDQENLRGSIGELPGLQILIRPVTMKQVSNLLRTTFPDEPGA